MSRSIESYLADLRTMISIMDIDLKNNDQCAIRFHAAELEKLAYEMALFATRECEE